MTKSLAARPQHFGLKHDLPSTFFGSRPGAIHLHRLDGDFGQCEFRHAGHDDKIYEVVKELEEAAEGGWRIPARLLNKTRTEGYAMGIGGVVGHLASTDIPEGVRFNFQDIAQRRAYWVWVKKVVPVGKSGRPFVTLTFKKP